jgi:lysophospholipase L1-like esterase
MQRKAFPAWVILSLIANGVFGVWVILLSSTPKPAPASDRNLFEDAPPALEASTSAPIPGPRHQLSYEAWVELLKQEATVTANQKPAHLSVLLGDSLSLWFPAQLLPPGEVWLNQGISGETSQGLLKRLSLLDHVKPQKIFVMVGINDLIKGVAPETVAQDERQIIRYLKRQHPEATIVLQSILPHGGEQVTWEGRSILIQIPNPEIQTLNATLAQIAAEEKVRYLDLSPLFVDGEGTLRQDLSSDGLHLNQRGYLVWSAALQLYSQLELSQL